MFSVEQRNRVRRCLLRLADEDPEIIAAAEVGSLAVGRGDRWSDLDLTFGIVGASPEAFLDGWTRRLADEFDAIPLLDLAQGPTTYRVFLLPEELQVDLSVTTAAEFRPGGPCFRLLFGETVDDNAPAAASANASELFG